MWIERLATILSTKDKKPSVLSGKEENLWFKNIFDIQAAYK